MTMTLDGTAGMTAPVGAVYNGLQMGASVSASGTSVDFTGIPVWVKRITLLLSEVSTNGTSSWLVQLGSGAFTTSGYASSSGQMFSVGGNSTASTAGFIMFSNSASSRFSGAVTIYNVTGTTWAATHTLGDATGNISLAGGGSVPLAGILDRVRLTTVGGANTFDAGTINIIYE